MLGLLGGFQILDGLLTHIFVSHELAREANPFVAILAKESYFPLLKLAGALTCIFLLWWVGKRYRHLAVIAASAHAVFYAVILGWNLLVLLKLS